MLSLPIWSSCSLIAVLTVLATVPIAAEVIVPNSASCSLIATTRLLAAVVRFSVIPTSSWISLRAATISIENI